MSANETGTLIICERSSRWADSLRRHRLCDELRLIETRTLAETEERLSEAPSALVGLELTAATIGRVAEWISRRPANIRAKAIFVCAQRGLRDYELLCREAGAVHFVDSELELFALAAMFDRYLSDPAFAKLNAAELPLEERIRVSLPW